MVFFIAKVSATYFTSIDDKATIAYFLELQFIRPQFSIKTNPDIDFLNMWSSA